MNEIRCPCCNHLLFKINGSCCVIETVCSVCKAMILWPDTVHPADIKAKVTREPKGRRVYS